MRDVLLRIVTFNEQIGGFWKEAQGWAPTSSTALLSTARLDWQVELSRSLRRWVRKPISNEAHASLILGWSNLGSLVEGSLKLILVVWTDAYRNDIHARKDRKGAVIDPDVLMLEQLRQFVIARDILPQWHAWIGHVQQRRNAIHSFKDRDLGGHAEFRRDVRTYLRFLRDVNTHLPYPEGGQPTEFDYHRLLKKAVDGLRNRRKRS